MQNDNDIIYYHLFKVYIMILSGHLATKIMGAKISRHEFGDHHAAVAVMGINIPSAVLLSINHAVSTKPGAQSISSVTAGHSAYLVVVLDNVNRCFLVVFTLHCRECHGFWVRL